MYLKNYFQENTLRSGKVYNLAYLELTTINHIGHNVINLKIIVLNIYSY